MLQITFSDNLSAIPRYSGDPNTGRHGILCCYSVGMPKGPVCGLSMGEFGKIFCEPRKYGQLLGNISEHLNTEDNLCVGLLTYFMLGMI